MKKLTFAYRKRPGEVLRTERGRKRRLGKTYDKTYDILGDFGFRLNAMGWEGNDFVLDYRLSEEY
jgi:hypothetical protein